MYHRQDRELRDPDEKATDQTSDRELRGPGKGRLQLASGQDGIHNRERDQGGALRHQEDTWGAVNDASEDDRGVPLL